MKVKKFKEKELIVCIICLILLILCVILFGIKGLFALPVLFGFVFIYWNRKKLIRKLNKLKNNKNSKNKTLSVNKSKSKIVKKTGKKKNDKKGKNIWKKILFGFLLIVIIGLIGIVSLFAYIVISTSDFNPEALKTKEQSIVYDINGEVIATLGMEKRENVKYDDLPQVLIDAIIATEDSRFFQHSGVDLPRFLKASGGQLFRALGIGSGNPGGASTLTMQVVKNNLTSRDQTIIRKFKDMYLSVFHLEKKYTKGEILEFYVNDSLLGGNVYGVGQASEYYFGKSVSELSLPEAAIIAGLFQSPNGDNPYKYPENTEKRRNTVLNLMVRHGYITKEESDIAKAIPVESLLVGVEAKTDYQGFIDTVVDEVVEKTGNDPGVVPMKIYTTLEKSIQDGLNAVLNGEVYTWENDVVQSGISVVNVKTGAIAALGSGRHRNGEKLFNYATMAERQPGSTAKPIFDYGPGFEYNNYSTYTLFMDEPWQYSDGKGIGNWDGGYSGLMTLKQAIAVSRNIPALKAFQEVKKKDITEFVENIGIKVTKTDKNGKTTNYLNEAYSIGGLDTGVTPLQMAAAYSAFASGGYYAEPYTVTKIEYRDSGDVEEFKVKREQVMKPSTAFMVNNILEYAVNHGFNGGSRVYGSHVAAKTGTSNFDEATLKAKKLPYHAVNDLWTVAYTSEYSIALWYGYDETTSEHYNSNGSPKDKVMAAVMKYIPKDEKGFEVPSDVVQSKVEFGTWPAKLPSDYTPSDLIYTEYFKKGTQPTEVSERFSKLDNVKNLKQSKLVNSITLTWDKVEPEVIDDDYLKKYFSQSRFGNSTNSLVDQRKAYNSSVLGEFGYGIYEKTASGLKYVDFVTDNKYTYKAKNSSVTALVVKAEYNKFKANASDGVEIEIDSANILEDLMAEFDNDNINIFKGSVVTSDLDDFNIFYNNDNVTDKSGVKTTYTFNNKIYTSLSDLIKDINKADKGSYKIVYNFTYKGITITKTKTINIK